MSLGSKILGSTSKAKHIMSHLWAKEKGTSMGQRKGANCGLKYVWILRSTSNAKRNVGNLAFFYF